MSEITASPEYVTSYRTALATYDAIRGNNRVANCQIIREGLIALALAPGTVKDKQIATGITWAKISRDVITGLWLAAHPDEDAIDAKACGNKLSKKQMADCQTVAALRKLMKKAPKVPKAPKVEDNTDTPEDTDTEPADLTPTGSKVITTPDEHANAVTSLALVLAGMYHTGQTPSEAAHKTMNSALVALSREMQAVAKAALVA